jgi:hypothetical protein
MDGTEKRFYFSLKENILNVNSVDVVILGKAGETLRVLDA